MSSPPPRPGIGSGPTKKPQVPVRRPPLPTLPNRAFDSPWEELAVAYEALPSPDAQSRLRWLYKAAEVWETGGKDIPRAFDALARAFAQARRAPQGDAEVRARLHRIAQEHKACARLEERYRYEGRWVELAASLEERTDPRLGSAAPEAERPQLLRELASIYTDRLHRPRGAIDAFERLRVLEPAEISILQRLADLYSEVGRWSKVIETLQKINETAEGSDEARKALHAIARIHEQELELPACV